MRIGTVELGKFPRIVLSMGNTGRDALELARSLKVDLVELRADLLNPFSIESIENSLNLISDYGFFSIFTVRPDWEGGGFLGTDDERMDIFNRFIRHPAVGAVDIEFRSGIRDDVVKLSRSLNKPSIVSYHDFNGMPDNEEIEGIAAKMVETEADIVKLAFFGVKPSDAARLSCLMVKLKFNKVFMLMGRYGRMTRVSGFDFGSLLTYTFLGSKTAPGQISAVDLIKLIGEFHPCVLRRKHLCLGI
jgi:3-dehydroquinate dehydratase-1